MELNRLRGKMAEAGVTQAELAAKIGIATQSLNAKMNGRKKFKLDEVVAIVNALRIDNPTDIFFAPNVPHLQRSG